MWTHHRALGFGCLAAAACLSCSSDDGAGPVTSVETRVAFQTQPPDAVKDSAFASPVTVAVLDQGGAVITSATGSVVIALGTNPSGATLGGTGTAGVVAGIATFAGLTLDSLGTGYTLVASRGALQSDTSATFDVTLSLADVDGDTYSPNTGDCNDSSAATNPGATDMPDGAYTDNNCDGIDGDISKAVFAASSGTDDGACGTREAPCQTIATALTRAAAQSKRDVYLMQGTYAGAVTLVNGVSIYGGYGASWSRAGGNTTTITGSDAVAAGGADPQALTIYGSNLTLPTTIADVTIVGPNTTSRLASGQGRSSYAVILRGVPASVLSIARVQIVAGNGASGASGTNGQDASPVDPIAAMNGVDGTIGAEPPSVPCDNASHGFGGAAGTNSAGGGLDPNGGAGGAGGEMDTDCGIFSLNLDATAGDAGLNAAVFSAAQFGQGGNGGPAFSGFCSGTAANGLPGRVQNGPAGAGATGSGLLIGGFWYARDGIDGGLGQNGSGGGGGGGAAGCDDGTDAWGSGGGGGGAGGRSAIAEATAGRGAGGSFGVYLIDASPSLTQVVITRGIGGTGGAGGIGGRGQSGGQGGVGPQGPGSIKAADGGDGAHGGHGGGGGGGAGGISAGVYASSSSSVPVLTGTTISGGSVGSGGAGGVSAPNAPTVERDGNDGGGGAAGVAIASGTCVSAGAC